MAFNYITKALNKIGSSGLPLVSGGNDNQSAARAASLNAGALYGGMTSVFTNYGGADDYERVIRETYENVLWAFRCVDAISNAYASLPLIGRVGDAENGEEVDLDATIAKLLNVRSNVYETAKQLKYRVAANALLSKRGAFVEVQRNKLDQIIGLHVLPPQNVEPIPHPRTFVSGYRFRMPDGHEIELTPESVLWFKVKPHPIDPYINVTPLMAAQLSVDTDLLARLYNRNFLKNDGRPATLVNVKGELDDDEMIRVNEIMNDTSPAGAGKTRILNADDVSIVDVSTSPRDVQWKEAIDGSKEDILLAFGVPESMLGRASGNTFANAAQEEVNYWNTTVHDFAGAMNQGFGAILDGDTVLACDYSGVKALNEAQAKIASAMEAKFQAGVATIDDVLEARGEEPLGVPGSRVYYLPQGYIVARLKEDAVAAAQQPIIGQPIETPMPDLSGAVQDATAPGEPSKAELDLFGPSTSTDQETAPTNNGNIDLNGLLARFDDTAGGATEGKVYRPKARAATCRNDWCDTEVKAAITEWDAMQGAIVPGRLLHAKARRYTRHWEGEGAGEKALNSKYVVQIERWLSDLTNSLTSVVGGMFRRNLRKTLNRMNTDGLIKNMIDAGLVKRGATLQRTVFGDKDPYKIVVEPLMRVAVKVARQRSEKLKTTVEEMDNQGATLNDIRDALQNEFGEGKWVHDLSEYLTAACLNATEDACYEQARGLVEKTWVSRKDDRVRPSHVAADGQTVDVVDKFDVGGFGLRFPKDPLAPIQETIGCRCRATYSLANKQEAKSVPMIVDAPILDPAVDVMFRFNELAQ